MAPPNIKKERSLPEKLDLTKNRFTASKVPNNVDVIVVGSGKTPAIDFSRGKILVFHFCRIYCR